MKLREQYTTADLPQLAPAKREEAPHLLLPCTLLFKWKVTENRQRF